MIKILLTIISTFVFCCTYSQNTVWLRPNASSGKDAYTNSLQPTSNFGNNQSLIVADWQTSGTNHTYRSFLSFDLTSIPVGSTITSAMLSLYNDPTSSFNNGQHSNVGGSNSIKIWRILSSWSESTINYNSTPSFTSTNAVVVPASTNNNQNFTNINVQGIVTYLFNNPASNHGIFMSLNIGGASPLRGVVLGSSDHPDSTKRPLLVVTYTGGCTAQITSSGPTTFCQGGNVNLIANSGTSYQWKNNGVNIPGATSQNYLATSAGIYSVIVTSGTCTATSSTVTVTVNPAPVATITAAGPTTFCVNSSVVLNANTGTGLTYLWKKNNATISGAISPFYTATSSGAYSVVVTNSSGCSVTSSSTTVIEILENASITASGGVVLQGFTSIACLNGGVTFNATIGTGYTYQWQLNGNNIAGATSVSYSTSAAGNYSCLISSSTCSVISNTISAQVQTAITNVSGSTTFCTGGPVLSTTLNFGSSSPSYQWQNNGTNISGATSLQYTPTTTGIYRCKITSAGFCNTPVYSNGVNIQAGVPPVINIASSNGQWPVSICNSQPVNLYITDANGNIYTGASGIQWYKNSVAIMDGTGWGNTLSSVLASGLYSVSITSNCGTSIPPMPIPVLNIHDAFISLSGSSCNPSLVVEPNQVSFAPYQWYLNGSVLPGISGHEIYPTMTGTYTCQISNGCGTNVIGPINVNSVPPAPIITASGSTTNCGGSVILNANNVGGWTYSWRKNGISLGVGGSSYVATTNGLFSVEVHNQSNCYGTSAAIGVLVSPPTAIITASGNTTFCSGGNVTLSTVAVIGQTYQWRKNGVNISGATSTNYIANSTGSYSCIITNACGSATSNAITVTVNSIPAKPGTISTSGIATVCPGTVKTYTIAAVAGATSYNWTAPIGGSVSSGQGTTSVVINYNAGFIANDSLKVTASNSCGTSLHRALSIKRNNPATPGAIVGSTYGLCNMLSVPYSVTNVAGITYNWSFYSTGGTVVSGQGTNAISVNYSGSLFADSLKVTASNACGTSAVRKISVRAIPATPVSIAGTIVVCANQQAVPYSIAPIPSAVSYTWTAPAGSTIFDGFTLSSGNSLITTSNSITVNYGTAGGTVRARANNTCGSGSYRTLNVTMNCREMILHDNNFEVSIVPNPSNENFYLTINNDVDKVNLLFITDIKGRQIYSSEIYTNEFTISGEILIPGIYVAEIRNNRGSKFLKLVKSD